MLNVPCHLTRSGNILEDETAVGVITAAKALGNDVATKQRETEATEAAIDAARATYAPAGDHASTLFFCISGGREGKGCVNWKCAPDHPEGCMRCPFTYLRPGRPTAARPRTLASPRASSNPSPPLEPQTSLSSTRCTSTPSPGSPHCCWQRRATRRAAMTSHGGSRPCRSS
jgi:hypothetical protein